MDRMIHNIVRRKLNERGGFTLLEAMIALAILSVGLLSLVGMFVTAIGATSRGGKETQAVMLAQQKLEEFKNTTYDNIASGEDGAKINVAGWPTDPLADSTYPAIFTRTWTVQENPAQVTGTDVKIVTVTVKWPASTAGQPEHQISLTTLTYNKT